MATFIFLTALTSIQVTKLFQPYVGEKKKKRQHWTQWKTSHLALGNQLFLYIHISTALGPSYKWTVINKAKGVSYKYSRKV